MVFPFVKLFGADERTCFEVMATFITNWAAEWFCMFPHPPLPVLGQVEKLMLFWDAGLRDSMARSTGGFQAASWSLLRTLMTELLSRQEWLKVKCTPARWNRSFGGPCRLAW